MKIENVLLDFESYLQPGISLVYIFRLDFLFDSLTISLLLTPDNHLLGLLVPLHDIAVANIIP
ncbi:hypothetical protein KCU90_g19659, partial [Aureobasidium melanogenum]